jgi:hypothetical protein
VHLGVCLLGVDTTEAQLSPTEIIRVAPDWRYAVVLFCGVRWSSGSVRVVSPNSQLFLYGGSSTILYNTKRTKTRCCRWKRGLSRSTLKCNSRSPSVGNLTSFRSSPWEETSQTG